MRWHSVENYVGAKFINLESCIDFLLIYVFATNLTAKFFNLESCNDNLSRDFLTNTVIFNLHKLNYMSLFK